MGRRIRSLEGSEQHHMIVKLDSEEMAIAERLASAAARDPAYVPGQLFFTVGKDSYAKKMQGFCGEMMVAKALRGWKVPPEKDTTLFDVIDCYGMPHEVKTVLSVDRIKRDTNNQWGPIVSGRTYKPNMPVWYVEILGSQDFSLGEIGHWEWSDNIWAMGEDISPRSEADSGPRVTITASAIMRLQRDLCQVAPAEFNELSSPWALRSLQPWQEEHLALCLKKYEPDCTS